MKSRANIALSVRISRRRPASRPAWAALRQGRSLTAGRRPPGESSRSRVQHRPVGLSRGRKAITAARRVRVAAARRRAPPWGGNGRRADGTGRRVWSGAARYDHRGDRRLLTGQSRHLVLCRAPRCAPSHVPPRSPRAAGGDTYPARSARVGGRGDRGHEPAPNRVPGSRLTAAAHHRCLPRGEHLASMRLPWFVIADASSPSGAGDPKGAGGNRRGPFPVVAYTGASSRAAALATVGTH